jgi:hypothetical protein
LAAALMAWMPVFAPASQVSSPSVTRITKFFCSPTAAAGRGGNMPVPPAGCAVAKVRTLSMAPPRGVDCVVVTPSSGGVTPCTWYQVASG